MVEPAIQRTSKISEQDWKYPLSPCTRSGLQATADEPPLDVPHRIRWAEYGNPMGEPVLFVHGGPGGSCTDDPKVTRYFDPGRYRIILFDQRGCGKNEPNIVSDAEHALRNNETRYLIADMVGLRRELGIRGKMHVFGGSWGSTLALAYAIAHPETVETLVMRGIFLCRRKELDYFFQGNAAADRPDDYAQAGAYMFFPEAWQRFVEVIADRKDRKDMVKAYAEIFNGKDEALKKKAARAWSAWEGSTSNLQPDIGDLDRFAEPDFAQAIARIENHYFMSGGFLDGHKRDHDYILEHVDRIKAIPIHVVQGRYDQVCPMYQAEELVAALRAVNARVNYVVTVAGHSSRDRETWRALTDIMDGLPRMNPAGAAMDEMAAAIRRIEDRLASVEQRMSGSPARKR